MLYIDGMRRGEYGEARTRLAVEMRREWVLRCLRGHGWSRVWLSGFASCDGAKGWREKENAMT